MVVGRDVAPVVGMEEQLEALHDALAAAHDGLVVVLVGAEPGMGKTTLARTFADEAAAVGVPVHWGSGIEVGGAPAFWPWREILRSLGTDAIEAARSRLEVRAEDPFAAYDTVLEILRERAATTRILVFDDIHRADIASIDLLRFLATAGRDLPLLVVATHRLHELGVDLVRDVAVADLASHARRITPATLGRSEVEVLLSSAMDGDRLSSAEAERLAADITERSGGNPLFVRHLADAVGRFGPDALVGIPHEIRAAVRARVEPLPAATRELLDTATVLGPDFRPEVLAAMRGVSVESVARDLVPAIETGILVRSNGTLTFAHLLVREALDDAVEEAVRRRRHAAAARAFADEGVAPAAVIAQHLLDAGTDADPTETARWTERAAEEAREVGGRVDAAVWSAASAEQWARVGDAQRQADQLDAAIGDQIIVGDGPAAVALAADLADLARAQGSGALLARAALARSEVFEPSQTFDVAVLLREALTHPDLPDDPRLRADLLGALADTLGIPSMDGPRRDAPGARSAIAALEDLAGGGDPHVRLRLLEARLAVDSGPQHFEDRRRWLAEIGDIAAPGPSVPARLGRLYWLTSLAFEAGDLVEVDHRLKEWESLAERSASSFWRWRAAMARACLLYVQGRLGDAEQHAMANMGLVANLNPEMGLRVTMGLIFAMRRDQGRLDELEDLGAANLGVLGMIVAADQDDPVETRRLLAVTVAEADRSAPDDLHWLCLTSLVAYGAEAVGDEELCRSAAHDLEPFADQSVMWGRSYVFAMPVSEAVGIAWRGAGEPDRAAAAFRSAVDWADRAGAPGFGARARAGLASVLPVGHPERGVLLETAAEVTARLRMDGVERSAVALLAAGSPDGGARTHAADDPVGTATGVAPTVTAQREPAHARVRTFGRFEVVPPGGSEPARWSSRKARDTLKMLICRRGHAIPREQLIDALWPDAALDAGRSRLSVVLSLVRAALDPERGLPKPPLRADRQAVALDLDVVSVDAEVFLDGAAAGLKALAADDAEAGRLLGAASAVAEQGTFLAEEPYAEFAMGMRSEVERTRREVLRALAGWAEGRGDTQEALGWWARLVELDPDDEEAYRALTARLDAEGRYGEAAGHRAARAARRRGPD